MTTVVLQLLVVVASLNIQEITSSTPVHHEVVSKLLKDYNPSLIPQNSSNVETVEIAAGLALIHIDNLSSTGVLTATAWLRLVWNDYRLQWNESDFGGVNVIRVDPNLLWLPDIEVYNTANPAHFSVTPQYKKVGTNALIYPDGEVLYIPPVRLEVICHNFTHSEWPQGEQECNIKLGSWTYDGDLLNVHLFNNKHAIDMKDFAKSSPWNITKQMGNVRNVKKYDCCDEPYPELNFRFKLAPQYPVTDPSSTPDLLTKLLGVSITILVVMVTGLGGVVSLYMRGKRMSMGMIRSDRRRIIEGDEIYSQSMGNIHE